MHDGSVETLAGIFTPVKPRLSLLVGLPVVVTSGYFSYSGSNLKGCIYQRIIPYIAVAFSFIQQIEVRNVYMT